MASLEIAESEDPERIQRLIADCAAAVESRHLRENRWEPRLRNSMRASKNAFRS